MHQMLHSSLLINSRFFPPSPINSFSQTDMNSPFFEEEGFFPLSLSLLLKFLEGNLSLFLILTKSENGSVKFLILVTV